MKEYLLSRASTGKFRFAIVEWDEEWKEPEHAFLITRKYGQIGGKVTESPKTWIEKGKAGRTHREQATLQFNSFVKGYLDKGYIKVPTDPNTYSEEKCTELFGEVKTNQYGIIKPQLAKQADKVTNKKIFDKEWLISRKLDGVKALFYWDGKEVHTASRGGEHYDVATTHLRENPQLIEFFKTNPTIILDGELFKRFKTLQQISGAARMEKNAYDCDWLEYWVYDCYDTANPDMIAEDRWKFLVGNFAQANNIPIYSVVLDDYVETPIKLLFHEHVSGWDNMNKLHDQWVAEGFEGAVITDPNKPYKPGSRCNNLIKIKHYQSEDFKVIGYKLGLRGSEDMTFTCELEDGRTFEAMPCGDRATKAEYVENFETKYKGHKAECTFFNYSDDNIPTQPKMRVFRFDLE